jgi:hypothetical protein
MEQDWSAETPFRGATNQREHQNQDGGSLCPDGTTANVHPDETGALKKTGNTLYYWKITRGTRD